jgi:hypothetical protein
MHKSQDKGQTWRHERLRLCGQKSSPMRRLLCECDSCSEELVREFAGDSSSEECSSSQDESAHWQQQQLHELPFALWTPSSSDS